jgi:hypothetical protein
MAKPKYTDTSEKGLEAHITQHLCFLLLLVFLESSTPSLCVVYGRAAEQRHQRGAISTLMND